MIRLRYERTSLLLYQKVKSDWMACQCWQALPWPQHSAWKCSRYVVHTWISLLRIPLEMWYEPCLVVLCRQLQPASPQASTMKIESKTGDIDSGDLQSWPSEFNKLRVGFVTSPYGCDSWNIAFLALSKGLGKPVMQNVVFWQNPEVRPRPFKVHNVFCRDHTRTTSTSVLAKTDLQFLTFGIAFGLLRPISKPWTLTHIAFSEEHPRLFDNFLRTEVETPWRTLRHCWDTSTHTISTA